MGRASGRVVRTLVRGVSGELAYVDANGYARRADTSDHLELEGFLGIGRLPEWIRKLIRPGDWVVDVGANVGLITAQLCRLVGGLGSVWAIEPIPRNVRRLEELARLNNLLQLRVMEGALSNVSGTADIRLPVAHESGWASFTKTYDTSGTLAATTWRLDELTAGQPGRISFIKIDVEGFEPQVIEGAAETLRAMHPFVLCEFNDILLRDAGTSASELLRLFAGHGYRPSEECAELSTALDGKITDLLLKFSP
jgi:FkbM family methyltransferase